MRSSRRMLFAATWLAMFVVCCAVLSGCAHWPIVAVAAYVVAAPIVDNIHIEEPWLVPLGHANAAADTCARAVAGEDLYGRGFRRDGGWNTQADAYRFTYTFDLDRAGSMQLIFPVEVSRDGLARVNVWTVSDPYFDYGADPALYRFPVGPDAAAEIALDAGLSEVRGPLRVRLSCEWSDRRLVWRVDRFVADEAYYDTVDVDRKTGKVLRRHRNHIIIHRNWQPERSASLQ